MDRILFALLQYGNKSCILYFKHLFHNDNTVSTNYILLPLFNQKNKSIIIINNESGHEKLLS